MANSQSGGGISLPDMFKVEYCNGIRVEHTGTLVDTAVKSHTLPAGTLGINGALRIRVTFDVLINFANADIRVRFGGTEIAKITEGTTGTPYSLSFILTCHNQGAENSQVWSFISLKETAILEMDCNKTSAIDTTANADIDIAVELGHTLDKVYISDVTIESRETP